MTLEDIFPDDVDRQDFLKTLAEACQKTDWRVDACCLIRNHYGLAVERPKTQHVSVPDDE
jgi:putative transposase